MQLSSWACRALQIFRHAILPLVASSLFVGSMYGQQPSVATPEPPASQTNPEFLATADEVLQEMSEITGWRLKTPVKKSIRSREEIHAYVLQQMNDEKDAKERYASTRTAEAFGLIPKDFNLEAFMVDLLTEQIAGLYDPKTHEFYIASWIAPEEQRMVMSHELTHALQDQYFHVEDWVHAAPPNDDAELARESVLEGSATAAMLEYILRDKGLKLEDIPDIDPSVFLGDLGETPMLKKAPPFINDSLIFPYFSGLSFSTSILKNGGWGAFSSVFARPPANTQQIMHPEIYRSARVPAPLKVDVPETLPGSDWNRLEENSLGEFGWKEVLKQFLDADRAKKMALGWDGDDYSIYENKNKKQWMLFTRLRLSDNSAASLFFALYSEVLEKKRKNRTNVAHGTQFLSFQTPDGDVFLQCSANQCISLEGADRSSFLQWTKKIGWPAPVLEPAEEPTPIATTTQLFKY
jgi:hypothetical protein